MDPSDPRAPRNDQHDSATRAATPHAVGAPPHAASAATAMMANAPPGAPLVGDTGAVATAATDPADPLIGTVVAQRYRLERRLGAGGMGAVYCAEHLTLRKRVAIKFLHREMTSNPELVKRFEREAVAAASLDHPNVVAATDFGQLPDGTFFLVMEFVEGRSLRAVLQTESPVPPARALRILRQIAAALSRAHGRGIVHRDLKPENVIVAERDGERDLVKVIDFGIARVTAGDAGASAPLTQAGAVFGTPEYMAPEQAMGQAVDARADQYAFGAIAFELFAGRRPFESDNAIDLLRMHVGQPAPLLTTIARGAPPALEAALARTLAKRPEERFDSVASAMDAFERALPGVAPGTWVGPAVAPPAPGAPIAERLLAPEQRPLLAGLVLGVLAVTLCTALLAKNGARVARHAAAAPTGQVDSRPIAQRLIEYQRAPDVADALARAMRGDTDTAVRVLAARRRANPDDGLAAYFLGTVEWTAGRGSDALDQYRAALAREPDLAQDTALAGAVVAALDDRTTAPSAEAMLRAPSLEQSPAIAQALARRALDGAEGPGQARALDALTDRVALLPRLTRARVMLRLAPNCDALRDALDELGAIDDDAARDEVRMVRSGACSFLRMRDRCRDCVDERAPTRRRGR